jgi:hypothetical protein
LVDEKIETLVVNEVVEIKVKEGIVEEKKEIVNIEKS